MKLALVFCIVGGLISCSIQQQRLFHDRWAPNNVIPRARLPYYSFADQDADIAELSPRFYELPPNDVQRRPETLSPLFKTSKSDNPLSRIFGYMMYNQLKHSLLFPSVSTITFTSTSTSFITVVSSISTVSIQYCISSTILAAGGSSACPVRKRSIELDAVEPSKVLPIESSRIIRSYNEQDSNSYVVSSSLSEFEESDEVAPRHVTRDLFPSYSRVLPRVPTTVQVVTVTSTTTIFSLIASAVKKPVAIASAPFTVAAIVGPPALPASVAGGVLCLPPGFVVC